MTTVAELRRHHRGPVITPDDDGYAAARITYNAMIEHRPALIARPLDAADVVTAVAYAREAGLPVSVRGGGHSVAGHCVGEGSVMVDLRLMHDVTVDPEARTATCAGGALWEDFDPPCQRHGLATSGGTFADTGVAGLTLGGGIGHLIGLHGLTLDNLLAATVVTADGRTIVATEDDHAELFWALRGGGGNFGVVTDFTFRLHEVGLLFGGLLVFDLDDAQSVLEAFRELREHGPERLTSMAILFRNAETGFSGVSLSIAYLGDEDDGRRALEPLGDLEPVHGELRPMYYTEIQDVFGRGTVGLRHYWSGRFLRGFPDEMIELTVDALEDPATDGGILLEPLHGAAARVSGDATAFAGREARYNATFLASWRSVEDDAANVERARAYSTALAPWALSAGYANYNVDQPAGELAFGERRYERLRAVKREYDPDNVFRFNHNIVP
jgi:FAD/FMN-containing dehydrogenase